MKKLRHVDNISVAGSIITFNPDTAKLEANMAAVLPQVKRLFLIDNHSDNYDRIRDLIQQFPRRKISLINYSKNKGLAYALNQALRCSLDVQCEWLVTLDQDSIIASNYIEGCKTFLRKNRMENVGIITPIIEDRNKSKRNLAGRPEFEKVLTCITSGAFTNVPISIHCGGFDNNLFIDRVDFDLCLTLRRNGYFVYRLNNYIISHEVGNISRFKLLRRNIYTTNHNASRIYYMYRNLMILKKKHSSLIRKDEEVKMWFRQKKKDLLGAIIVRFLFENDKMGKLKSVLRGIVDGIRYQYSSGS